MTAAFDGTLRYYNAEPVEPVWVAVNLPEGKAVTFSPAGQILHGDPATVDSELIYLVENSQGTLDLLTPADFRHRVAPTQPKPEPAPTADAKNYQLEFTGGACYVETPVKYDGSPLSSFRGVGSAFNHPVVWSPDGKRLACAGAGYKHVRICDPNGDNPTILDPAVIEKQLVYLVERPTGGIDVLKPSEFAVLRSLFDQ